ncbi:SRPBCC family protein [Massilia pinisoli]|uniref:SRPBCC family protein n=1 Tax=Massilia pinisoli TaxID=1772194 RepID=A0ABT1ZZ39_9BURK|nr:SRPBCC family protein [Massilia pinisoli]MCS0585193.1 SRPBCC family protein [Massilia pinisoli]
MKFEHLIEINDPLNPLMDTITRDQLWRGLVLRAEDPKLFVPHLDECTISERESGSFSRRLRYGDLVIDDKVFLRPLHEVRFEVPAQGDIAQSLLTMTIETPTENALVVRFCYDDGNASASDDIGKMYEDFKKSAYQESDIDTVKVVRQLAAEGKLDASRLN